MFIRSCILAAAAAAIAASPARAASDAPILSVVVDHARVLKIPRPAATVIIGNPAIADVSVQDSTTMVLTGRSYGITNLIVLDADGQTIIDESVGVQSFEDGSVRIYRQAERETYFCSPECEPTVTVGDNAFAFERSFEQTTSRQKLAMPSEK